MTTKSNSTFGPFDDHGRFIGTVPVEPLGWDFIIEEKPIKCEHTRITHRRFGLGQCDVCGCVMNYTPEGWVERKEQPELTPLAPSPWSPVAPTEPGLFLHSKGDLERDQKMTLVDWAYLGLGGRRGLCAFPQMESVIELGGFWRSLASPAAPDRFAETLATCCEKLEQQCRVLRCGYFDATAAVIEGVMETLRAAYAAKGAK